MDRVYDFSDRNWDSETMDNILNLCDKALPNDVIILNNFKQSTIHIYKDSEYPQIISVSAITPIGFCQTTDICVDDELFEVLNMIFAGKVKEINLRYWGEDCGYC